MSKEINHVVELLDSYKAKAAFVVPFLGGLGVMVANWIETNKWDDIEFKILLSGLVTAIFTAGVTYLTPAGNAVTEVMPGTEIADAENR